MFRSNGHAPEFEYVKWPEIFSDSGLQKKDRTLVIDLNGKRNGGEQRGEQN